MKMDNLLKSPHVILSAHSHLPTLSHRTKFSPPKGKAEVEEPVPRNVSDGRGNGELLDCSENKGGPNSFDL